MYSVVLAAMLTAGPTVTPACGYGYGGYCGSYSSCCCSDYSSCYSGCSSYCSPCCYSSCSSYCSPCCYCGNCYSDYSGCCSTCYPSCYYGGYSCCGNSGYYSSSGYYGDPGYYGNSGYYGNPGYYGGSYGAATVEERVRQLVEERVRQYLGRLNGSYGAARVTRPYVAAAPSPRATVIVKAPLDASILVNGQSIEHTQAEQTFTTPELKAGKAYVYEFRAEAVRDGKTVTLNQRVTVQAGRQSRADFGELARNDAPARVTIKAPADARVTVDDVNVPRTSQMFQTPPLAGGRAYFYTVKADMVRDGKAVSQSKRVTLEAGKDVLVEFQEPSVATASR